MNPPLFEYDEDKKTWAAAHHAFTRPHDECVDLLDKDPGKVLCYRYDLVLNGFEIGGGSIRLHDPEVQAKVFRALGITDEEARAKFGFLLDALRFGAPPHGGIALGMDRLAMLLSGAEQPARRDPVPEDAEGHRPHDRRAERGHARAARRAAHSSRRAAAMKAARCGFRRCDASGAAALTVDLGAAASCMNDASHIYVGEGTDPGAAVAAPPRSTSYEGALTRVVATMCGAAVVADGRRSTRAVSQQWPLARGIRLDVGGTTECSTADD